MKIIGGLRSIGYAMRASYRTGFFKMSQSMRSKNTCKSCAYGSGGQRGGMTDEAGNYPEVCKKSFQANLSDIQNAIDPDIFNRFSIDDFRRMNGREIDRLGRLTHTIYKNAGDTHYRIISPSEAIRIISEKMKTISGRRSFFYNSGRSSNEAGFLLQLFARLYGSNNISNSAYYCHQASGAGISSCIGTGTATITLKDLDKADLIFVIGANPPSNHPRFMKQLINCRARGGKVIVVNPVREPGLMRFAIPSKFRSLFFGSEVASEFVQVRCGGDIALMKGIAKAIIDKGEFDTDFIQNYTNGFDEYRADIDNIGWDEIIENSGIRREQIEKIADIYSRSKNAVFSWAVGITHHIHGVENVESIVSLAMLRGMIGRPGAGLLPLRGHSNVQGIGSVGATPQLKEIVKNNIEKELGVRMPDYDGNDTMSSMKAAENGDIDFAIMLGGNLYNSNPDSKFAERSLDSIPFKIYLTTTLNQGHFYGVSGETIVLPVAARDEELQKTTQESMFNYVRLSDGGIARFPDVQSEVEIICSIAENVIGKSALDFSQFRSHAHIRKLIGRTIPGYEKMLTIDETGEEFQIAGRTFHTPLFATPDKKARFVITQIPDNMRDENFFKMISVRSEGQFNNIIYENADTHRGQTARNVVLMNPADIRKMGCKPDDLMILKTDTGRMTDMILRPFDIAAGNILTYFPEANEIIPAATDPRCHTPAYKNVGVKVIKQV